MKQRIILSFCLIFIFSTNLMAWNKNKSILMIQEAESMVNDLDYNYELKEFIPHDEYSEAVISIRSARIQFDKDNFKMAYFYAAISIVKIETTSIIAKARKARYEKLSLERDYYRDHQAITEKSTAPGNEIVDAGLLKKDNVYRTIMLDKRIFTQKGYRLTKSARNQLDRIAAVLEKHPQAGIKIVGHSSYRDLKYYTRRKAESIKNYLISKGTTTDRISVIGLGNTEAMDTAVGYRRIDRIEIIITGIE